MRVIFLSLMLVSASALAVDYSQSESWLCRPDSPDACASDQTTTVINADGSMALETFIPHPAPEIDCFYVYPTVSLDKNPNSDMVAGSEEMSVISAQFARFGSVCRTFAPLYRQVTLTALRAGMSGQPMAADRELGYNDVLDAWNYYLKNDNNGRGVVLIGHSQGAGVLTALIAAEIDGKPIQSQLVSALILGSSGVTTPTADEVVGGTFQHIPVCKSAGQTGCVIQYASFRDTVPPPADSLFGRPRRGDGVSVCTNPANLAGGPGELHAYLGNNAGSPAWVTPEVEVSTPFVSVPGLLSARCVNEGGFSYLQVTVQADAADPRTDSIGGDVIVEGAVVPGWGLHLVDVHLAMGNLIALVGSQAENWSQER